LIQSIEANTLICRFNGVINIINTAIVTLVIIRIASNDFM